LGVGSNHPYVAVPYVVPPSLITLGTGATTGRCEPETISARSPMLTIDDAIKGRWDGIIGRTTD
jgi:hypothetical protein